MITKNQYEKYEKVRCEGLLNMFDVKNVCLLSGLSREEVLEIMKNYSALKQKYEEPDAIALVRMKYADEQRDDAQDRELIARGEM